MRDMFRQMHMAMAMNEVEQRLQERSMIMHALGAGGGMSAQAEEERLLQRAIEESKQEAVSDPNSPDVDNMTHEQLLQLQERAGHVNRGFSK